MPRPLRRRAALLPAEFSGALAIQRQEIRDLIKYALDTEHTNASQVLLIPFISGFLIFRDQRRIFARVQSAVFAGILIALVGVALAAAGHFWGVSADEGNRLALTTSSILAIWLGLFVGFYGLEAFRVALFPLLFLLFCIPIPSAILNTLITLLQRGSAEITLILLRLSGTLVYREGFLFIMPGLSIVVAPECSGIRSCLSVFILTIPPADIS